MTTSSSVKIFGLNPFALSVEISDGQLMQNLSFLKISVFANKTAFYKLRGSLNAKQ
jgi:hypothetical protein